MVGTESDLPDCKVFFFLYCIIFSFFSPSTNRLVGCCFFSPFSRLSDNRCGENKRRGKNDNHCLSRENKEEEKKSRRAKRMLECGESELEVCACWYNISKLSQADDTYILYTVS